MIVATTGPAPRAVPASLCPECVQDRDGTARLLSGALGVGLVGLSLLALAAWLGW
jgi:hypothetical protein